MLIYNHNGPSTKFWRGILLNIPAKRVGIQRAGFPGNGVVKKPGPFAGWGSPTATIETACSLENLFSKNGFETKTGCPSVITPIPPVRWKMRLLPDEVRLTHAIIPLLSVMTGRITNLFFIWTPLSQRFRKSEFSIGGIEAGSMTGGIKGENLLEQAGNRDVATSWIPWKMPGPVYCNPWRGNI